MNGQNIGTFDPTAPADTQSAGLGDDAIRSVKTTMQQVFNDEHNFPSAGGSVVGYHQYGSARPYYGTQSRVSSSGTDGRLMMTSDTSRLFGVGSGGTVFLGGSQSLSVGTDAATAPGRAHWVDEFGLGVTGSNGSQEITIPNSGYSGFPFIQVTPFQHATAGLASTCILSVLTLTPSTFAVAAWETGSLQYQSGIQFFWQSRGTRTL